jgi:hypothetical protein
MINSPAGIFTIGMEDGSPVGLSYTEIAVAVSFIGPGKLVAPGLAVPGDAQASTLAANPITPRPISAMALGRVSLFIHCLLAAQPLLRRLQMGIGDKAISTFKVTFWPQDRSKPSQGFLAWAVLRMPGG